MAIDRVGGDPVPRAGEGGAAQSLSRLTGLLNGTYVQAVIASAAFGTLDPTGVADSSAALQAWLNAIPDGGSGDLPSGTYRAAGLSVIGKSVTLNFRGKLVQASDAVILNLKGGWDTPITVSALANTNRTVNTLSRDQAQLTLATAPGWVPGDTIRLYSDDVVSGARPGDGTNESRRGEFATVFEVSGTTVYLSGPVRDTYTTNIRAARLSSAKVRVSGLRVETPDAGMATWTSQLINLEALNGPVLDGVTIRQGCATGIQLVGCIGYRIRGADIRYLNNNPDGSQYGYGVLDNACENGVVDAPYVQNVRHGFTDDTPRIPVATASPSPYGKSRNATIRNGTAVGVSGAAWDAHHAGEGHHFDGCTAVDSESGFSLRGQRHRVTRSFVRSCRSGFTIFTESSAALTFGMVLDHCYVYDALFQAISVSNLNRDNRTTCTIRGGEYTARTQVLNVSLATVIVTGNPRFLHRIGGGITNDSMVVLAANAAVQVDGLTIETSAATSGSGISFFSLADSNCSVTGRRLNLTAGSASVFMAGQFVGVSGNTGTVTLYDVQPDTSAAALTPLTNLSASSIATAAFPSNESLWRYATDMQANGGSPTVTWQGSAGDQRTTIMSMPAAAITDVACAVPVPSEWSKANVTLVWTNAGAGTGNVVWELNRSVVGDGDDFTTKTNTVVTDAAPAGNILKYTALASGISLTKGKLLILRLRRTGTNASDTLANATGIVGVLVSRTA